MTARSDVWILSRSGCSDCYAPRVRNILAHGGHVRPADDRHRVTTFELFFDLVFVFAITQVTGYMAHAHSWMGILQGFLLLGLLWWVWSGYTWLGNQAHADVGVVRAGMSVAMAAVFLVALTIPEAWEDAPGGLNGPLVLVGAYIAVRLIHLGVYAFAAAGDEGLMRQLAITLIPMLSGSALLLIGALLGGTAQTFLFAAGLAVDWVWTYMTSRGGGWRIHSPGHWSERHGLFMILAIGESVVAIGAGAADLPISSALAAAAILGVAISICLWWLYFDIVSLAAERSLHRATGTARVMLAIDAYTYLHFPLVAGVVLSALGVEEVLAHVQENEGLGYFAAVGLYGGPALYLFGHIGFKRRLHGAVNVPRSFTALLLCAAIPLGAWMPPLPGLALVTAILGALVALETARHSEIRKQLRSDEAGGGPLSVDREFDPTIS